MERAYCGAAAVCAPLLDRRSDLQDRSGMSLATTIRAERGVPLTDRFWLVWRI